MGMKVHMFYTSTLDGGKLSVSCSATAFLLCVELLGFRVNPHVVYIQESYPCQDSNPDCPVCDQPLY